MIIGISFLPTTVLTKPCFHKTRKIFFLNSVCSTTRTFEVFGLDDGDGESLRDNVVLDGEAEAAGKSRGILVAQSGVQVLVLQGGTAASGNKGVCQR